MFKKFFCVAAVAAAIASCSEPAAVTAPADVSVVDGRLAFRDFQSFNNFLTGLQSTNAVEVTKRLDNFDFVSLEKAIASSYVMGNMPANLQHYQDQLGQDYRRVLNSDAIVQIGDDVIKFADGIKYYQKVADFGKTDITLSKNLGHYAMIPVSGPKATAGDRQISNWMNGTVGAGGDQFQFSLLDGSQRKFVNEWVVSYQTNYPTSIDGCDPYNTTTTLVLRIKLEGRPNSGASWTLAPEPRYISWNLHFPVTYSYAYYFKYCNGDTSHPNSYGFADHTYTGSATFTTTTTPNTGSYEVNTLTFTDDMDYPFSFDKGQYQACAVGTIEQDYTSLPNNTYPGYQTIFYYSNTCP